MADLLFQDVLAKQNGKQDTDGGTDKIQQERILELRIDDQIADAMRQLLDDDSGSTRKESRRDAEYQHETTVRHVGQAPLVEAVNPSIKLVFEGHLSCFAAAKIGKSMAQTKKK